MLLVYQVENRAVHDSLNPSNVLINIHTCTHMHTTVHMLIQAPIFNPDTTDPVEHYELIYREASGGENTSQIVLPEATPTTFVDVTITGLKKGTRYVLFVIAYNSRGPGRTFTSVVVETIVDRKMFFHKFSEICLGLFHHVCQKL